MDEAPASASWADGRGPMSNQDTTTGAELFEPETVDAGLGDPMNVDEFTSYGNTFNEWNDQALDGLGAAQPFDASATKNEIGQIEYTANDNGAPFEGDGINLAPGAELSNIAPGEERLPNQAERLLSSARASEDTQAKIQAQQDKLREQYRKKNPEQPGPFNVASSPQIQNQETGGAAVFVEENEATNLQAPGKGFVINDDIAKSFELAKAEFEKKKQAGSVDVEQEIDFMRLEGEENKRVKRLQADLEDAAAEAQNSDTGSEDEKESESEGDRSFSESEAPEDDDGRQEPPKRRKRNANRYANDDDYDPERPQGRGNKRTTAKSKAKRPVGIEKSAPKGRKRGTKAEKTKKKLDLVNVESLKGNNVFADYATTSHLRKDQPSAEATKRRDEALKQMLKSVPVEDQKVARSDRDKLKTAISNLARLSVTSAGDGLWAVKGMRVTLKSYQIMGVGFMRDRERSDEQPRGGILADAPGLGKTIMMLTNIIDGMPKNKTDLRTTLIVASPALIRQWSDEIRDRCCTKEQGSPRYIGRVVQLGAGSKIVANDPEAMLKEADIVLTTYHQVSTSYPRAIVPTNLVTAKQKEEWWQKVFDENCGTLHRVQFLRIVLDEAHAIKNHLGHTSRACRALKAEHRWCISGTPITNTVREFYPHLKFIGEPLAGSYRAFEENFCSPEDPDGSNKLTVFLKRVMIRRTHGDTMFNARLVDLPDPKEQTVWLDFNHVERQVYQTIRRRIINRVNGIIRNRNEKRKRVNVWTMVLRLRQICGHILLIQSTVLDILEREDFEELNSISAFQEDWSEGCEDLLISMRGILRRYQASKNVVMPRVDEPLFQNGSVPLETANQDSGLLDSGRTHGKNYRMGRYIKAVTHSDRFKEIADRAKCALCNQRPDNPQITSCFHIYCLTCLTDLQHSAAKKGIDQARCEECGAAYTSSRPCEEPESLGSNGSDTMQTGKKRSRPAKEEALGMEDWLQMGGDILSSPKTRAVKAQVAEWLCQDGDHKIIIFTQFLDMVHILAKVCITENWGYCTYTGKMSLDSRGKHIDDFRDLPEKKILLASLRCGGLGLNLSMASRCIILDPWWNNAVEQQAFCRIFRIGQTKETRMVRLIVRDTIDEAMVAIKDNKQIAIDAIMSDKKLPPMKTMLEWFGVVRNDDEGRPFIVVEDDDSHRRGPPPLEEGEEEQEMGNEV